MKHFPLWKALILEIQALTGFCLLFFKQRNHCLPQEVDSFTRQDLATYCWGLCEWCDFLPEGCSFWPPGGMPWALAGAELRRELCGHTLAVGYRPGLQQQPPCLWSCSCTQHRCLHPAQDEGFWFQLEIGAELYSTNIWGHRHYWSQHFCETRD